MKTKKILLVLVLSLSVASLSAISAPLGYIGGGDIDDARSWTAIVKSKDRVRLPNGNITFVDVYYHISASTQQYCQNQYNSYMASPGVTSVQHCLPQY